MERKVTSMDLIDPALAAYGGTVSADQLWTCLQYEKALREEIELVQQFVAGWRRHLVAHNAQEDKVVEYDTETGDAKEEKE